MSAQRELLRELAQLLRVPEAGSNNLGEFVANRSDELAQVLDTDPHKLARARALDDAELLPHITRLLGRARDRRNRDDLARRRDRSIAAAIRLGQTARWTELGVELDVDVKIPGYGPRVVAALRESGLIERSLVSGMYVEELDTMRALEPALRVGWSVPRLRRDYTTDMLTAIPALVILSGYRALLPRRARAALQAGRFDAIMAHWRLVTGALVRAVAEGGGELYAWTVDDAAQIARLSAMGVDAIITNDPRLFG